MDDLVLDVDAMKADLASAVDDALGIADRLALEVVDSPRKTPDAFMLARTYQEKRVDVRLLRLAIKAEVER